jgi:hypothetical protein
MMVCPDFVMTGIVASDVNGVRKAATSAILPSNTSTWPFVINDSPVKMQTSFNKKELFGIVIVESDLYGVLVFPVDP